MASVVRHPGGKPKTAVATYGVTDLNDVHQIDLLFLSTDPATHARDALTVVDLATRAVAARPLKTKNGAEVLTALQNIYSTDPRLKAP